MPQTHLLRAAGLLPLLVLTTGAQAFTFENEDGTIRGSFDSTIAAGIGVRTQGPSCDLVVPGASGKGAPAGCLSPLAGVYDQGNLNYGKGDLFTGYFKGTHELVLKLPSEVTVMARGTWLRDLAATHTTGIRSGLASVEGADGLTGPAREDLRFKARLLDLWVSKSFDVGGQSVRVRFGNQVINWGESLYLGGGINATNSLDLQRLALPGTQLKEGLLPAPMISVASGLGNGLNIEGYYQFGWNKSYLPPVGSYWNTGYSLGTGNSAFGVHEAKAKNSGQWGLALKWQPPESTLNFGAYVLNYHDKLPQLRVDQTDFSQHWQYLENRKLYGLSVNFPLGDWAIGSELSYRPKEAVALNPALTGCALRGGRCWIDTARWQWSVNGIYALNPSNARPLLDFAKADSGTLLLELAATRFPHLRREYGGDPISAGYLGWGQQDGASAPTAGGTKTSGGIVMDFSLTYDGSLINGWQVVPGVYYYQSLGGGRTATLAAPFLRGNRQVNFYVGFNSLPAKWSVTLNYSRFSGGATPLDNLMRDRSYFGMAVSRTF